MSSIDERIVQMQFNNNGFENGVNTTMKSLENLNKSLKMKGATDGLSDIDKGIRNLSANGLNGISRGVETVTAKFSALGIIGVTALANITNSAVNAGKNLVKSFTLDPIMDGFSEYELKMNSIQTILTNTASHGTTLDDVNAALNELNAYSDKTIYNFAQMTDNIGKATAAGLTLGDAVTFVKGMSNAAAIFGVDSTRMAGATYQMTQALSAGVVKLQDWRSLEQSGMGGKIMQDEMIAAAEGMGIFVDKSVPFRDSLESGWLTSEVFMKGMDNIANNKTYEAAAANVTSFTKLLGTMKEQIGSGWASTFEAIFGDKEQSTKLWTGISNSFGELVTKSADARNKIFEDWNKLGGRDDVIKGLSNIIGGIGKGLGSVGKAFKEVFPPMTGKKLVEMSEGFKNLSENFKMSDKTANMIKDTFKGVFSVIDFGKNVVVNLFKAFIPLTSVFASVGKVLLTLTSSIGRFFSTINKAVSDSGIFDSIANGVENAFSNIGKFLDNASKSVEGFFTALSRLNFEPIFNFISQVGSGLGKGLESIFGGLGKLIGNIDFNTIFGVIGALAAGKGLGTIKSIGETFKGMFDSISGITENATSVLDSVRESLQAYQDNLNASILLKLALSVGILALALGILSSIDAESIESALVGITVLMAELIIGMAALLKIASGSKMKGFWSVSTALVAFSTSVLILSAAMKTLSNLKWDEIAKGLISIAGLMTILIVSSKLMSKSSKGLIKTSIGLVILSVALNNLTKAVENLGELNTGQMIQGLLGVGALLTGLTLFTKFAKLNNMGMTSSAGIFILAVALNVLASAVDIFASMDTNALIQGLFGVGAVLLELTAFMKISGNAGNIISTATGLIILGVALTMLSGAVKSFGSMQWETIGKGLLSMGGALIIIAGAVRLIPPNLIITAVGLGLMAGSLIILSEALKSLGGQSWEQLAISLVALSASLIIIAGAMAMMTTGLAGAAAMVVMSLALALFVPQLTALSMLNPQQLAIGLMALAGVFVVLGLAGVVLTPVIPALLGLSGAIALLGLGCMAAALGVTIFAAGLATLATVGAAGGLVLIELFKQLINLLPQLGQKLAEAIVAFVVAIGEGIPQIVTAFGQMLSGILEAFTTAIPEIVTAASELITAILEVLGEAIPELVTIGVNIIVKIVEGIASNMGRLTTAAVDIIVTFINGVASNLGKIIQAGINLAISFVNGLADGIERNSSRFSQAVLRLIRACIVAIGGTIGQFISAGAKLIGGLISGIGQKIGAAKDKAKSVVTGAISSMKSAITGAVSVGAQMISGFIEGIKSKVTSLANAARNAAARAIKAAEEKLGVASPSKVFIGIGKYTILGLVKGLKKYKDMVVTPSENLAQAAIDATSKPLSKFSDILSGGIDSNPVISPVIDLDDIKKGTKFIDNMMDESRDMALSTTMTGSISGSIGKIQNGTSNNDVVSAIKDLKNSINKKNGDTYQINGITYDDGTNISTAVETLVRASVMEGRV